MKKTLNIIVLVSNFFFSQVGINTTDPNATLDVVGKPTDPIVPDGFTPPRLTLLELNAKNDSYTTLQTGSIIYVSDINALPVSDKVKFVSSPGYYVFNGAVWLPLEAQTGEVIFKAKYETPQTISHYTWRRIRLSPVLSIGGGIWNTGDNTYTISVSGTYLVSARFRIHDSSPKKDININVDKVLADTPTSIWRTTEAGASNTLDFSKALYFEKGDKIHLFTLHDGGAYGNNTMLTINSASLNLILLSTTGK